MTGAGHYAKAEQLLATGDPRDVGLAQVHATLAAAAASACISYQNGASIARWRNYELCPVTENAA